MTIQTPPPKRDVFLGLLDQGWVSVILDARCEGVVLPTHLREQAQLRLDYGLDMPTPIEDLDVNEQGITATLSFNRQPHDTFVPWSAVYVVAQADGAGVLYPEAVPPEVQDSLDAGQREQGDLDDFDDPHDLDELPPAGAAQPALAAEETLDEDPEPEAPTGPRLGLVPPEADQRDGEAGEDGQGADDAPTPGPHRKPRLRLVK